MILADLVLRVAIGLFFALLPPLGGSTVPQGAAAVEFPARRAEWQVASGSATVYHGDVAGAHDRAVAAALLRGLERQSGLRLEGSTLVRQGELVERELRARTGGFVRDYKVVSSRRDGDQVTVGVLLDVADDVDAASFAPIAGASATLLVVCERDLDRAPGNRVVGALLAAPFLRAPHSLAVGDAVLCEGFAAGSRDLDPDEVRTLADRHAAATIVVAAVESAPLDSGTRSLGYTVASSALRPVAAARAAAAIYSGATGERLAGLAVDDARGSDASRPERAAEEARVRAGGRLRNLLVERLAAGVRDEGYPLRIVVHGHRARGGAAGLVARLETSRWFERIELVAESAGQVELRAHCRERPALMVAELRGEPGLEIVRFDAARALVEVR